MKELLSIRTREKTYRLVIIIVCVVATVISLGSLAFTYKAMEESKKNIYVLQSSTSLVRASSSDINNVYDILFKAQIEDINKLLYQQVPDPEDINNKLKKAMVMSDESVSKIIDALKQADYYNSIVAQNYFTVLSTDSINIDYSRSPYEFKFYGTLKMMRDGQSSTREIVTHGFVEDTKQPTKNNERGFLIRNITIEVDKPKQ